MARLTQKKDQTSFQSIERFLKWVKEIKELTLIPNLFLLDRGYDCASDLFALWFGTLKKGPHCIYAEPTSRRPCKYFNQVKILPEGLQVNYEHVVTTYNGKSQYQSAFLSNGHVTYMTAPAGHRSFGSNLLGVWLAIPIRPSLLTGQLPLLPISRLPAGSKIYTSGQERDALWHVARASCITSRTAFSLINACIQMRHSILEAHAWILYFFGFNDFSPLPSCTFTHAQVDAFTQKKRLYDAMLSAGCIPSKTSSQLSQITLSVLKAEFKNFIENPPPPPSPESLWTKLGPIMLASMLLKPLDGEKIKSLRNGLENESNVLKRLTSDLNEKFLNSTPLRAVNTYRIGLAAAPEASANRMATSVDGVVEFNDQSLSLVEVKSATTTATAAALESLTTAGPKFDDIAFNDAAIPSIDEIENHINEGIETSAFVLQVNNFAKAVPDRTHRVQILHHSSSLNVPNLLYIQADMTKTQRIRLLRDTPTILQRYRALIADILHLLDYQTFAENLRFYPSTEESKLAGKKLLVLDQVHQKTKPHYRDVFSVAQQFALGHLIRSQSETPPPIFRLKPAKNHLWNIHKGHDDVASEYRETIAGNFHTPAATYLTLRLLDTQTLNAFRCQRMFLGIGDVDTSDSIQIFRKSLTRGSTLRQFLMESASDFIQAFTFLPARPASDYPIYRERFSERYPTFKLLSIHRQRIFNNLVNARYIRVSEPVFEWDVV